MADVEKSQTDKPEFEGEWVRLGDVCEIVNGATPRTGVPEYWGGDIKWVTPAELRSEIHTVFDTAKHLTKAGFESASLRMMPAGTILLTTRAPIGKLALAGDEMCCNQGFKCLICPETVNNEWLCRLLKHRVPELQAMGAGATFKELSKRAISDYRICVPPMETQIDIVKKLTKLDEVLANCRTLLSALDDLVKSQFVEMFGDPIANSNALPTKKLIDVVTMQRGYDLPVTQRVGDGGVPVYGSNGIVGFHDVSRRTEPCVVTGRSGTIGDVRFVQRPCWPLNTTLFSSDTHGNNVIYLAYLLKFFKLERFTAGSGVPTLNRNLFHKELIIDAPLALQQQFADFVAEVDKLRFDVQQQIEKLEALKQSLMQDYFG